MWFRGFPAAAVTLGGVAGCAQGGARALRCWVAHVRKGLLWVGGFLGSVLVLGGEPRGVLAADGPTAVVGGVWLTTAREVKAMGHRNTVLALPVPFPLDAVPLLDAFSVDFEGDAVSPPLL